jgi:hypothetical protein
MTHPNKIKLIKRAQQISLMKNIFEKIIFNGRRVSARAVIKIRESRKLHLRSAAEKFRQEYRRKGLKDKALNMAWKHYQTQKSFF